MGTKRIAPGCVVLFLVFVAETSALGEPPPYASGATCPARGQEPHADSQSAGKLGLKVAADLQVTRWADETVTGDLQSLTFDPDGVLWVSAPGWIKALGCTTGAPLERNIMATPSGVMGLTAERDGVTLASDGAFAFVPLREGKLRPAERTALMEVHQGEHGPHQISRGPDGSWYALAGNEDRWKAPAVDSSSWHSRAGKWMRWSSDRTHAEILADGLRNPYRFDVTADGDFLTFDSDGERDVSLPWYLPTRLMSLLQGGDHGWLMPGWTSSYALPPAVPDRVDVLSLIGRASPTGVVVYRHNLLPSRYRQGVFIADWTFGRILFVPLKRSGTPQTPGASLVAGIPESILSATSTEGFAPSDMQVGPDGALYVAIGGRRTRGSVFRIGPAQPQKVSKPQDDAVSKILLAPQPLTSWSRAVWEPAARNAGAAAFVTAARDRKRNVEERLRAIEITVALFEGIVGDNAIALATDKEPRVRARVAWAIGRTMAARKLVDKPGLLTLSKLALDKASLVRQRALTAFADLPRDPTPSLISEAIVQAVFANLGHVDRRVALAAAAAAVSLDESAWQKLGDLAAAAPFASKLGFHLTSALRARRYGKTADGLVNEALTLWPQARTPAQALAVVRLLQIGLGDFVLAKASAPVFALYAPAAPVALPLAQRARSALRTRFPSGSHALDQELLRTLAMLEDDDPQLYRRALKSVTPQSTATWDAHVIIALARMGGSGAATAKVQNDTALALAETLLSLKPKLGTKAEGLLGNWDARIGEALQAHLVRNPLLADALAKHPRLARSANLSIALALPDKQRAAAARRFLAAATTGAQPMAWTESLIDLLTALPASDIVPHLRARGGELGLRDKVVAILAKEPRQEDRRLFIDALHSPTHSVRAMALSALAALPLSHDKQDLQDEVAAEHAWLRKLFGSPPEAKARAALRARLATLIPDSAAPVVRESVPATGSSLTKEHATFVAWVAVKRPEAVQSDDAPVTAEAFLAQLGAVPWQKGNSRRGEDLLRQRACLGCHSGSAPIGPALAGVGKRMSRDDLLTAILDPSRDVSSLYAATTYDTRNGESVTGLTSYEADVIMLRTGATTMVRLSAGDVISRRPADSSLMPSGLLEGLGAQDVADLFAHLQSLQ